MALSRENAEELMQQIVNDVLRDPAGWAAAHVIRPKTGEKFPTTLLGPKILCATQDTLLDAGATPELASELSVKADSLAITEGRMLHPEVLW